VSVFAAFCIWFGLYVVIIAAVLALFAVNPRDNDR